MIRKRGAPVFIELMRAGASEGANRPDGSPVVVPAHPAPPAAPGPPGRPPSSVSVSSARPGGTGEGSSEVVATIRPAAATVEPKPHKGGAGGVSGGAYAVGEQAGTNAGSMNLFWMGLAGIVVVFVIVWYVAFSLGQDQGEKQTKDALSGIVDQDRTRVAEKSGKAGTGVTPPAPAPRDRAPRPADPPTAPTPPVVAAGGVVDKLLAGYNYLVVATLMRRDADESAKYLADNKLPVFVLPAGGVDASDERVNNPSFLWEVVIVKGFPAPLGRSEAQRAELVNEVQRLGRKWKADNKRAPTDFGQVFWRKLTGKP